MPHFHSDSLAEITSGQWHHSRSDVTCGFAIDSRKILPGQMFIALKSSERDGHDFIADAMARGAGSALVEYVVGDVDLPQLSVDDTRKALQQIGAFQRQRYTGMVIGITGSCGKTSTKELLACLLGRENVHATQGNLNNDLGVPLTLVCLEHEAGKEKPFAVIEAGTNQPGEIALLGSLIKPNYSIITNVGATHLEGLGNIEGVASEKAAMIHATESDGYVLFPRDCLQYTAFHNLNRKCTILCSEVLDAKNESDQFHSRMLQYRIETRDEMTASGDCLLHLRQSPGQLLTYQLHLLSPGMVENAALCLFLAGELGVEQDLLQKRLLLYQPPADRGYLHRKEDQLIYLDCYNASPASLLDSVRGFQLRTPEEMARLYVIGAMAELGESAGELHRSTARKIRLRPTDQLIFHGDHASAFMQGFVEGGNQPKQGKTVKNRDDLKNFIEGFSGAILLKGSRAYKLENLIPGLTECLTERISQC